LFEEVNFCVRCGNGLIRAERIGRIRPVCPVCDWIYFPDPKVAVASVIRKDGEILMVRRAIDPHRGLWTLPAGFVDAGEDPAQTAVRECFEETGLQVRIIRLLDVISGQEHPKGAHILIVYQAEIVSGNLIPGDDVDNAQFFSPTEFPPLAFSSTRKILDSIKPL